MKNKALKYLINKGWKFHDLKETEEHLKKAFLANLLIHSIVYLNNRGWNIVDLEAMKEINQAKKIWQKHHNS
jgi:hypothetical protein